MKRNISCLSTWTPLGGLLACALATSVTAAWQGGGYPQTYPQTQYPNTQYPNTQYPNTQYPNTQYPNTQYPTAQYPSTPAVGGPNLNGQRGLPQPPSQPLPTARPNNWPGGATASDRPAPARAAASPRPVEAQRVSAELPSPQDVQIVALVGSDPILGSDVMPFVIEQLNAARGQIPPEQFEAVQAQLIRQRLKSLIETKTVLADARRNVPKENLKNIEKTIGEGFEKREVPNLMKRTKTETRTELVIKLQEMGTSLDREKHAYFEKQLAQQWLQQQVRKDTEGEITHDEMLTWYFDHVAEYETQARVRWQQLSVRVTDPRNKGPAWEKICDMGNRVVVQRVPFAEVAKQFSDGATAADGGLRVWTTQGSLVSKPLDDALFSPELPVGKMSQVIEDSQGYHIVLVLEREAAGRQPFQKVQSEIKDKIKKERFQEGVKKYMAELKKIPVWTMYDAQQDGPKAGDRLTGRPESGPSR